MKVFDPQHNTEIHPNIYQSPKPGALVMYVDPETGEFDHKTAPLGAPYCQTFDGDNLPRVPEGRIMVVYPKKGERNLYYFKYFDRQLAE